MLYPVSYSIPEEIIVPFVPFKSQHKAENQYGFTTVDDYLANYRKCIFAHTSMKCGWDCLRHYEILSQGTIPHFIDLANCPKQTLHSFPKQQVQRLIDTYYDLSFSDIMRCSSSTLYNDLDELLNYTKIHLTTTAEAKYILSKTPTPDTKKILFLTNIPICGDYLIELMAHGLFKITDGECDFYPDMDARYDNFPLEESYKLYGKGFNYTRFLPSARRKCTTAEQIWKRIQERHYDTIFIAVCHAYSEPFPFFKEPNHLLKYYSPNEISILCGRDCDPFWSPEKNWYIRMNHSCDYAAFSDSMNVFVREFGD